MRIALTTYLLVISAILFGQKYKHRSDWAENIRKQYPNDYFFTGLGIGNIKEYSSEQDLFEKLKGDAIREVSGSIRQQINSIATQTTINDYSNGKITTEEVFRAISEIITSSEVVGIELQHYFPDKSGEACVFAGVSKRKLAEYYTSMIEQLLKIIDDALNIPTQWNNSEEKVICLSRYNEKSITFDALTKEVIKYQCSLIAVSGIHNDRRLNNEKLELLTNKKEYLSQQKISVSVICENILDEYDKIISSQLKQELQTKCNVKISETDADFSLNIVDINFTTKEQDGFIFLYTDMYFNFIDNKSKKLCHNTCVRAIKGGGMTLIDANIASIKNSSIEIIKIINYDIKTK